VGRAADDVDRLWRGFRRPILRDRAFWIAVALSIVVVLIEGGLATAAGIGNWFAVGVVAAFVVVAVFSVVGAIAGSYRGLRVGLKEGPHDRQTAKARPAPEPDPDPAPRTEPVDRLTQSLNDLGASARAKAANVRKPTADDVDRGARKLGRAFGAARKAFQDDDPA
jgi:hypothetical protein